MSFTNNYNGFDAEYAPQLRHAPSAGGWRSEDETWVILSWYDTIHKLTPEEIITVGVGMSGSQNRI